MSAYVPPDPSVAEFIHGKYEAARRYAEQLKYLDEHDVRKLVADRDQPSDLRVIALLQLVPRRTRERRAELLSEFLDDPDPLVSARALQWCPLIDECSLEKVRQVLDSHDNRVMCEAVIALAKVGDPSLFPQLREWFVGEDTEKHYIAIVGLKTLATQDARAELEQGYEAGGRDDTDRATLADALLRLGDKRGVHFLRMLADTAQGPLSVMAATTLYAEESPDNGLKLMLHILDSGDLEAKRSMVQQIWNFAHLPHAFTADGIHEARLWVQQKLESPQKHGP